jgi:hypothetical protein
MRLAIHQPNFLPRLKVLQKLASADLWCVLDCVQFNVREWQNRARVVAVHGNHQSSWISVPVCRPHGLNTLICDITVVAPLSTARLVETSLFHALRRAPCWAAVENLLTELKPSLSAETITRLCVDTTCALLRLTGRVPPVVFASSLGATGKASSLIAAICERLHATTYLADSGARNYLRPEPFAGIEVLWQIWHEPEERCSGITSWRDLSSVNYLARVGPAPFSQHLLTCELVSNPVWESLRSAKP